jgi:glutamate synthase domain-containing protein 2
MAYGTALSEKAKIVLAKASSVVGTATNTGDGTYLPEERKYAQKLIVQVSRGGWTSFEAIRSADMVEIQAGQGATGGGPRLTEARDFRGRARKLMDLPQGRDALIHAHLPGGTGLKNLRKLIDNCRYESGGVPIGVKIGAGTSSLEKDLALILEAGADFVTVDGANAGTKGSLPTLQDDFGLPTIFALLRSVDFLKSQGAREELDIIISGGLDSPGDYLKALALGADACAIGTAVLLAMTRIQMLAATPWDPPTKIIWHKGKSAKKFNVEKGTQDLINCFNSVRVEMEDCIRALGKTSLAELSAVDLTAITFEAWMTTGIRPAFPTKHLRTLTGQT